MKSVVRPLNTPRPQPHAHSRAPSAATAERIERAWPGETVFCLGSGPSLCVEDVEAIRGRGRVIVINTTFRLAPWADVLYAADASWWAETPDALSFAGERWSAATNEHRGRAVRLVRVVPGAGLARNPAELRSGGHSGHQVINFAVHRGAARIALLGYDMQCTGGLTHWHGDHPEPLKNLRNFESRIEGMRRLALELAQRGVECINCSRETALTCFKREPLERCL